MSGPDKRFIQFRDACHEQDVELDHYVAIDGLDGANDGDGKNYTPSGILAAVQEAGRTLGNEKRPLANKIIVPEEDFSDDLATASLINIINASIEPRAVDSARYSYNSHSINRIDTCRQAEIGFLRTFIGMKNVNEQGYVTMGAQIFQAGGVPVFVRKYAGSHYSALSLESVGINGIPYPAGSIFSMKFRAQESPDEEKADTPDVGPVKLEFFSARSIYAIRFLRLSAFALSQAERREAGFVPPPHIEEEEDELYMQAELSDFKDAVTEAKGRLDELYGSVGEVGLQEALAA